MGGCGIRVSSAWSDREEAVRKRLRSYRALVAQYRACEELCESLFPSITSRVQEVASRVSAENPVEARTIDILDLQERMRHSLAEMMNRITSISDMIRDLPPDEHTILLRRYMLGENMETVSEAMSLSVRQCWTKHGKAIRTLAKDFSDLQ
jgi:DNA-directed RNA polymerase specialized sigma24 family protein